MKDIYCKSCKHLNLFVPGEDDEKCEACGEKLE